MAADETCGAGDKDRFAHGIPPDYLPAFIGRVSAENFWYDARISTLVQASWQLAATTL
jgi:hypothetical protein